MEYVAYTYIHAYIHTYCQAKAFCDSSDDCVAFTFESKHTRPARPENVWFKRIAYTDMSGHGWHTYVKKCSQPSQNRFMYVYVQSECGYSWIRRVCVCIYIYIYIGAFSLFRTDCFVYTYVVYIPIHRYVLMGNTHMYACMYVQSTLDRYNESV